MAQESKKITIIISTMIIWSILVLRPTTCYNLDARCNWNSFIPPYCNIQPWETGNSMSCHNRFLDVRLLAMYNGDSSGQCLAKILSLTYTCTDPKQSSDLTNLTFGAYPNLISLQLTNCNFARLHQINLAHPKVNTINIVNIFHDQHAHFVMDAWSIRQLLRLDILRISGMNVSLFPRNEFCNIQRYLDLSDNVLTDVHSLNFGYYSQYEPNFSTNGACGEQIKFLNLMSNRLTILPDNGFSNLKNLKSLYLENNRIEIIQEKAFDNLRDLAYLYLEKNRITSLISRMWLDLPNLIDLRIDSNKIGGTLSYMNFNKMNRLELLYITLNNINQIHSFPTMNLLENLFLIDNSITTIREGAFLNISKSLSALYLQNNRLTHISKMTFQGLNKLQILDIRHNMLETIEFTAFQCCPNLIHLNLFTNHLKTVPDFSYLYNIQHLHISGNKIESLPDNCFTKLTALKFLSLGRNMLTAISKLMFAKNVELTNIHIYENKLSEISMGLFRQNTALEELQLHNNSIKTIPRLTELTKLKQLDMQINAIENLDFNLLPNSLIKVNMSHNNITTFSIPFDSFKNFELKSLDVSHNLLEAIPSQFKSLVKLDISHNLLTKLPSEAFQSLNELHEVNLCNNQLQTLDRAAVKISAAEGAPAYFLLKGNLLRCDCTMWWINEVNYPTVKLPVGQAGQLSNRYGQILDIDSVNCTVRVLGNAEVEVMPFSQVSQDRFLCDFRHDTELLKIHLNTLKNPYSIQCPAKCRCYFNHDWSLITTYCSSRGLKTVPQHMPPNSIYIYIDGNDITTFTVDSFDAYNFVTKLFINSSNIHTIMDNVFENMIKLQELHLEDNRIETLSQRVFAGLTNLLELYLQSNVLRMLHPQVILAPGFIRVVRLDNNSLTSFPPFDLMAATTITRLTLSKNRWVCQCTNDTKQKLNLLDQMSNKFMDKNNTRCYSLNSQVNGMPLFKFYAEMCDDLALSHSTIIYILVSVLVVLLVVVGTILAFVYRYEMQVLLYCRYNFRLFPQLEDEPSQANGKLFDAFIAYSSHDEAFVVDELVPRLEGERHFKLCLHHRNFKVGGFITNSILEAVEFSRRTIVVMSENFATSNWCRFEFKSAHDKMMVDRCRRLIMIVLGDVPDNLDPDMQLYFKTNTYLQHGDRLFWEKLYFAMPKRGLCTSAYALAQIGEAGQGVPEFLDK